jgi:zinc protease
MYPGHPYGCSQLGYKDTIERLTRDDIEVFYRQHYGARGMTAVIVGALPREKGLDVLQEAVGAWEGAQYEQAPLPPTTSISEPVRTHTTIPGKTQSDVVLGWIGPTRQDPGFLPACLANCILGQFGLMGRIGESVREEQGLAYYAYTSLDAGIGPGPWAAMAGVAPDHVEQAVGAIMAEMERLRTEPVDRDELADSKAYIVGSLPLRLEGNEAIAAQIANMELFQLGLDHLRRFPDLIDALSADDVMSVARRILNPEACVLSVAGP